MTWVYLDDKFHSNPKVLAMGNPAAGLFARALSYCGDHLTDGLVPMGWAKAAGTKGQRDKLVELEAWLPVVGGYLIPDYLTLNPSREKVETKRAAKAAAGALGGKQKAANHLAGASPLLPGSVGTVPTPLPLSSKPKAVVVGVAERPRVSLFQPPQHLKEAS